MNNPTPTLPNGQGLNLSAEFLELTGKRFADSYNWLNEQYNNKCKRLADYANLLKHSPKYVLQETAFLSSLYNHLDRIKENEKFLHVVMQSNAELSKQILLMEKIFAIYGISAFEILKYLNDEKLLDATLKLFKNESILAATPISILLQNRKQEAA